MSPDPATQDNASTRPAMADTEFRLRLAKTRHDLNNAISQILGFSMITHQAK